MHKNGSSTRKQFIMIIAALIVAGFALLNLLAYNQARAMLHFTDSGSRTSKPENIGGWSKLKVLLTGVNLPRPTSNLKPTALDPECTELAITNRNEHPSISLCAWYCNRGTNTPLVVLFHGYSAEKTALLNEAKAFLELGNSVLLVDFRGSGGSSESYTTIGVDEANDVTTVVRYANKHLQHKSLILFGQSMGAVAILRAVHTDGIRPDAVILEAVFDTMLNTVRNRFEVMKVPSFPSAQLLVFWGGIQWGFNGFKHNPVDYVSSLNCPALFMHGRDDPRAKLAEGRRVFDAAHCQKQFIEFSAVGHESYLSKHPQQWKATLSSFLLSNDSL